MLNVYLNLIKHIKWNEHLNKELYSIACASKLVLYEHTKSMQRFCQQTCLYNSLTLNAFKIIIIDIEK